jgi:hypothetical protein
MSVIAHKKERVVFLQSKLLPRSTANFSVCIGIARAEPDEPCAETRFRLSEKRTSPFESAGVSAQSAGRRLCVNIVS